MNNNIIKLLNLEGFLVGKTEALSKEKKIFITVRSPRNRAPCPICGKTTKKIHQHKSRQVKHGWFQGRQIILKAYCRRFKCKACQKAFTEKLPGIDRKRHTLKFRENALSELKMASFSSTAQKIGTTPTSLTRFLTELQTTSKIMWPQRGEIQLGIDAHSFAGRDLVITICELKRHRLLAVLKDDRQMTLINFLEAIPKPVKARIKAVCIDMESSFRNAVKRVLPQAVIVADKYHVLKEADRSLESIRLIIQGIQSRKYERIPKQLLLKPQQRLTDKEKAKLEQIWQRYQMFPCLKEAWIIKEKVRDLYFSPNYQIAEYKLKLLIGMLEGEKTGELKVLVGTLKRWRPYILNYFKTYITNGYTEGVNNKIKLIKRISFGFRNINNYIAKITLAFLPLIWLLNLHTFC